MKQGLDEVSLANFVAAGMSAGLKPSGRPDLGLLVGDPGTAIAGVFTAGDMQRGQSLIVWAIAEGRRAADGGAGCDRACGTRVDCSSRSSLTRSILRLPTTITGGKR